MIDVPENTAKRNGDQMKTEKWIIFGMLVALLAGCSGKKTAEEAMTEVKSQTDSLVEGTYSGERS